MENESHTASFALPAARLLIGWLRFLLVLVAAAIFVLFVATLIAPVPVLTAIGVPPEPQTAAMIFGMRAIMLLGIASAALAWSILGRLAAIVASVGRGEAFVAANAGHLRAIAWIQVALQLIGLAIGAIASAVSSPAHPLDIGFDPGVTGWLAILLLFVLARVFEEGARMREELEATI